jgi:ankyrin repeat protein
MVFLFGCSSGENTIQKAEEAITALDYDQAALYAKQARQSPEKQKARIILSYIKYGDNMLHAAFWEEDIEALQYLAGIIHDINKRDERFDAPVLVLAAAWGHADMIIILLEAGADPNYGTDKDGYTALMWAVKNFDEQLEMTRALLEAGAEVNVRSNYGETPLSIAEEYQNPNIFALLREYDAVE